MRAGYSWDGGVDHHVTGPGPERLAPDAATQAFFDHEPGHVLVARDADGEPCGYAIAFGADTVVAARARRSASRAAGSRTRAGEKRSCGGTR